MTVPTVLAALLAYVLFILWLGPYLGRRNGRPMQ